MCSIPAGTFRKLKWQWGKPKGYINVSIPMFKRRSWLLRHLERKGIAIRQTKKTRSSVQRWFCCWGACKIRELHQGKPRDTLKSVNISIHNTVRHTHTHTHILRHTSRKAPAHTPKLPGTWISSFLAVFNRLFFWTDNGSEHTGFMQASWIAYVLMKLQLWFGHRSGEQQMIFVIWASIWRETEDLCALGINLESNRWSLWFGHRSGEQQRIFVIWA
jgi:hypothetical protein